jgi:hypothetical protein
MDIKVNPKIDPIVSSVSARRPRETERPRDGASFDHAEALNNALKVSAEARAEKVELAKKLIASINYPPPEVINRIANLLAIRIDDDGSAQSAPPV